jgi:hypothetical protein
MWWVLSIRCMWRGRQTVKGVPFFFFTLYFQWVEGN